MFRNPLVNVDGPAGSQAALLRAIDIAWESRGRIGLLAPLPRLSAWIACPPFAPAISRRQMEKQLEAAAQRSVDEAERAVPADIPVTKLVVRRKPVAALLTLAQRGPWDVLVVGDRLAGCFQEPYGIARLLRASPVPVLVVSGGRAQAPAPGVQSDRRFSKVRSAAVVPD